MERRFSVSIIPRAGADVELRDRLQAFRHSSASGLTAKSFADIIHDANQAMGIRISENDLSSSLQTFSEDILKIEISGPDQEHFTVIDVPGIFHVPSPPFTTDADVKLVRNMIEGYLQNDRTIILAVLPSNVDHATQEILKLAETFDPEGARTMGVLTKPDLVHELTMRDTIKNLVLGHRIRTRLRLGCCIVKNRSADDHTSTLAERLRAENDFFRDSYWRELLPSGRCGVMSLKARLSDLLLSVSKKEFPHVNADITEQLRQRQQELDNLGLPRTEQTTQRIYLAKIATRFQALTQYALNGNYNGETIFAQQPTLKLATAITKLNETFSNIMWQRGHKRKFDAAFSGSNEEPYETAEGCDCWVNFQETLERFPELHDVVSDVAYSCRTPSFSPDNRLLDHIDKVYQSNRGPELGTVELSHLPVMHTDLVFAQFSGSILAIAFKEQSDKWEPTVLAHVSKCIVLVHHYIFELLIHVCPEPQVRQQLWDHSLGELRKP